MTEGGDGKQLGEMAIRARTFAHPRAAERIAEFSCSASFVSINLVLEIH